MEISNMGLDMYLTAVDEDCYELEEVISWGKSNQILNWFRNHVCGGSIEGGTYYEVPRKKLEELERDCGRVLEDNSLASVLIPTGTGTVRTGSAEYDSRYFRDLEYTRREIREALEYCDEMYPNCRFSFEASW